MPCLCPLEPRGLPMSNSPNPILDELKEKLAAPLLRILENDRDGAAHLLRGLPKSYPPAKVADQNATSPAFRAWELAGLFYLHQNRVHEALAIFAALYDQLCASQSSGKRVHKGTPLLWMLECYVRMGFPAIAKRYLMLTLCEDAIGYNGNIMPNSSGLYFRAVWRHGMTDEEVKRYAKRIYALFQKHPRECFFPEWTLQELDRHWMEVVPAAAEAFVYTANTRYVKHLLRQLGDRPGLMLERLSDYVLSCMPGCRVARRTVSRSTDYDLVCSMDGLDVDFRSELGRYFVCECKDWKSPADFTTMAKFCRVLDSTKSRFGILFSRKGISGAGKARYSENEQLKIFQDRGMVIVAIDQADLMAVARGANFIAMLRRKYERVRLDLIHRPLVVPT